MISRLIFALFFLLPAKAFLQNNQEQFIFHHLTQRDGLLHNSVYAIIQDKQGFMWIASKNGLQRYDGYRFKNYPQVAAKFSTDASIRNLYADNQQSLWLQSDRLGRLNTATNQLDVFSINDVFKIKGLRFDAYTDDKKNEWQLSEFGAFAMDSATKTMQAKNIFLPHVDVKYGNYTAVDSAAKATWSKTAEGLQYFDWRTRKIYTHAYNPLHQPLLNFIVGKDVSCILIDKAQTVWVATWKGELMAYSPATKQIKVYDLGTLKNDFTYEARGTINVSCLYQDTRGTLWIGTDHAGLLRYDGNGDFRFINDKSFQSQGVNYNYSFYAITEDRDGNIWLGTDKGISIFNPYQQYLQTLSHSENATGSLPKFEIMYTLGSSTGDIFVGTWGGGFSIFDHSFRFKKTIAPKGVYELPLLWSGVEADDRTIWIGTQHGYVHLYNPRTSSLKTLHPPELENYTVWCMKKDNDGNIWFGLHNGRVAEWEKKTGKFYAGANSAINSTEPIKNLFIDTHGYIWASTDNGLLLYDKVIRSFIARYVAFKKSTATDVKTFGAVEELNDSTLLVGTARNGLFSFNTRTKTFHAPPQFSSLANQNIYAVKKDRTGNVWLTTDYDLYQLDSSLNQLKKFMVEPGLLNASFEGLQFMPAQDGRWLTFTNMEVVSFIPAMLGPSNRPHHSIAITGFKVLDSDYGADSLIQNAQAIKLKSDQNFINIEFSSFAYSSSTEENFQYRLSGVDKDWVKSDERANARYTNLDPGDYTFEVKSADGNKDSPVTKLSFTISPPFYLTWWFLALCISVALVLLFVVARKRINSIRYEASLKHRIVEAEINALRSQMNPHFIFNCLNAIDSLIQTNQPDKATTYLARFARLMRLLLDSSKNNLVPFYKDFEALKLYLELEQFRAGNKFRYHLDADEKLLNGDYKVPPLIVQPFVENAIHHGLLNRLNGGGQLSVKATVNNEIIQYVITDNGVGRTRASAIKQQNKPEHQSYGISITTERIQLHNHSDSVKSLTIKDLEANGVAVGTQVEINVKIDHA